MATLICAHESWKLKLNTATSFEMVEQIYAEARKAALEAQALNPEDGMTYFVLAQCYGAQASGANFTSQAMYWVAYDTMEKAAQLLEEADLKETATKMMAAFRSAWPSNCLLYTSPSPRDS